MDALGIRECEDCQAIFDEYLGDLREKLCITTYLHALGDKETFIKLVERCEKEGRPAPAHYREGALREIALTFDDEADQ